MDLQLGVQITRPVGGLAFASTETDAVFILFAHLPGFMKDEIEVELNEAGTEISISSRGEIGERSFIDAEISGRVRISHHELMEGFRKAFPIPNNVVLDQIEVGFEEEEDILIVLLPRLTREEEPLGVEIEEINEENIREEEEEEENEDDDDDDDDDDERTSMTIEAEETSLDYNKEKAQEQQNLGEVEPKNSTEKFKGKHDGKPEAGSREATTKIAIGDKEDNESEFIIEELVFPITTSISKEPIASKSEEEEKEKEEEAPEQKNLNELEVCKSLEALESEAEGLEFKEIAIRAQIDDKEEEIGLIIEKLNFTIIPLPLEEPIIFEAFEVEEEEEEEKEEEETTLDEKEQQQNNLYELEHTISLEESEGEPDEEIEPQCKEIAIEAEIINDDEEKNELIIEEPDFTTIPPQEEQIALKASDSKEEEKKKEEEEKEKTAWEEVVEQKDLDELELKKILETLESELDGKTNSEYREMTIEAQSGDKEEEKVGLIKDESDFTRTSPSEEHVASKISELKEKEKKSTREEVPKQNDLDKLEPKKNSKVLEGEFDGKTKQEHREMTIEAQTGDKEKEKTGLIRKEPEFIKAPLPSEEPVTSKASELKEEKENATGKGVAEQQNLEELKPKKILEALEGESDEKTKTEHREMAIEVQSGNKDEKKTRFIREEPDFTRTPPSEKSIASKTFELKEEEKKATWEEVLEKKDLDELEPKKISKALESEYDGKTKLEHREMVIEAQTDDKKEEKIRLIKEDPGFTRTPPSEELIASKAFELKEEEEKAIGEEKPEQKDLDKLELKKISEILEDEPDGKIKLTHQEMIIETQTGDKEEEKIGLIRDESDFTKTPPLEKPVVSKVFELKEKWDEATKEVSEQKDLGELELKKISNVLENESDGKTKPEHREMAIEAQIGDEKEEKTILVKDEPYFIRTPPLSEKPVASKTFELKEEEEKTTGREESKQKDLDEVGPKKISEALEGEYDGKTKPESREMTIEAQTDQKKEEKIGIIRDEPDFTRISQPSEKSIVSKAFELKEEDEKATEKKVQEQKDLGELESKNNSEVLEDESDEKTKPEYQKMAIEAQIGNKEEEKNGRTREELDFTRTPPPSEESIALKAFELKEEKEKATEEEVPEQKDLDEYEPKKISKTLEDEPDGKTKLEHREITIEVQIGDKEEKKIELIRDEPDFTRTPPPLEKLVALNVSELKEKGDEATREEVSKQKDLGELELKKISKVLESEFDGKTKPEHREMTIESQIGDKKEEKTILIRDKPDFIRTPPLTEKPVALKTFELKEDEEKTTWGEVSEQKDFDEVGPKKISEALEDESDGKTKPESRETIIEAQTSNKNEEKIGLIREEPDFTRASPSPLKESIVSKTFELKEEEEKAIEKKVQEQKDLDELESKKMSKVLEDESDGKTKPEYQEMAIEAQIGDKEEEKNGLTKVEPDFTRTPPPSEEPIASKAFQLKEEEEKATREEVSEQKDLDELESKKILEAIEGEPDGKTKSEHREMTIEAQTSDKEEKPSPIREESDFTRTPLPSEESVASKASELKEEEKKTTWEEVSEQKDLDELDQKKNSEVLEGESNGKIKPEYREMAIKAQIGDKEEEKTELIREAPNFSKTPLSLKEPVASKAFELKEEEDNVTRKEVSKQKDLNELEPKKILEALEGEPDGKSKPKHQEMAIEAQTSAEEEKNGLIRKEPYLTITPLPSEEPVASKASKLKEEKEKVIGKEVPEQKYLDEIDPKKNLEALEGEFNGKTKREYREMAIEEQTGDKEEEKIRLIREGPYFIRTSLLSEKSVASKASELEKEEKKAARKDVQERKDLDTLELEKGIEASEGEPNEEIELVPTEMTIEAPSEHKEEEQTRIHTEEPEFTIAPPALEEPILSNASKLKEEEEKAHMENTEEPKNLEKKIQSKTFEEEKKEKAIEEKSQEQKSLDELQVKKSSEEIEGESCRETKPEPKKTAIGTQTKYKEEEETRRITEEPDITVSLSPLEDLIASKASKSKEENEEQHEKTPIEETPYSPPISPNIMAKPKSNREQLDTTDSHEERDRDVEVPGQALETFESIESSEQEEDRHGFGQEDAKEPKNMEEITHDPAPKTLTRTVTPKDVDSDRRREGEHEARETKIRALREDDREIVSDVDGGENASREWEEGESSDRDREESRGEMETRKEEQRNNGNEMNGIGKKAQGKRRRRRKRGSSFHLSPTDVIAGSVFVLTLAALVIRLIKKRRSHTMR